MAKKISATYWNTLKKFEQDYIRQRADIDGIQALKLRINAARKKYPNYTKIYGKGFIELPNGDTLLWSGEDTRKFHKVVNGSIIIE
ncbi:MAG TPA: hypothetical protein VEA58_04090 [Anaerovoracaceae bacterium]|nr:hypothetical protein [Anaerovoracaceae bacterium]